MRQVGDMILQLTNRAGDCQVPFPDGKPYAMSINMGGNDKTVVSFVMGTGKYTKQTALGPRTIEAEEPAPESDREG